MIRSTLLGRSVAAGLVLLSAAPAAAQSSLPTGEKTLTLPPSMRGGGSSAPEPAAKPAPAAPKPAPRPQAQPARPAPKPPAQAARPANPTPPAAPAVARPQAPGTPAIPVIVPGGGAAPAETAEARPPTPLTPEQLRPSPDNVLDCKDAPKTAVTQVPAEIARWATVYCTKTGHVFTTNDRHFARFPRSPVLGRFNAAQITGRKDDLGHAAHFTKIAYTPIPRAEADALVAGVGQANEGFVKGKDLYRLDLTVDTGQTFSMVVIDPVKDPFWVMTLADGKPARTFFVASLDHLNQKR